MGLWCGAVGGLDFLSVNENWNEVAVSDKENMNHPSNLAVEATCISQNLTQQMLEKEVEADDKWDLGEPNPFLDKVAKKVCVWPAPCLALPSALCCLTSVTPPGLCADGAGFDRLPLSRHQPTRNGTYSPLLFSSLPSPPSLPSRRGAGVVGNEGRESATCAAGQELLESCE